MIRKAAEPELRAESERDRIRGRVLETKADQRKRGRHLGGRRPFGFRIEKGADDIRGGQLIPDEREQTAIAEMRALRADGQSLRAIAAALKERGFSISHEGVAEVLKREASEDAAPKGRSKGESSTESSKSLGAMEAVKRERKPGRSLLDIAAELEARYRAAGRATGDRTATTFGAPFGARQPKKRTPDKSDTPQIARKLCLIF